MRLCNLMARVKVLCLMSCPESQVTLSLQEMSLIKGKSIRPGTWWKSAERCILAFQYPVEIPGVSNIYLMKAALNAIRKHKGLPEVDAMDF